MSLRFRATEFGRYEPPACPNCGRRVDAHWIEVSTYSDPEPVFMPINHLCPCTLTPGATNDR